MSLLTLLTAHMKTFSLPLASKFSFKQINVTLIHLASVLWSRKLLEKYSLYGDDDSYSRGETKEIGKYQTNHNIVSLIF
jgi:hypothetical protein